MHGWTLYMHGWTLYSMVFMKWRIYVYNFWCIFIVGSNPFPPNKYFIWKWGSQKYTVVSNDLDTNLQWDWVICIL